jgi:hypothetical protein
LIKFEQNFPKLSNMVVGKERVHTGLAWNAPAVGRAAMTRWWQQLRQMVATARRQASRSVHEMGATSRNIQGASSDVGKHRAALTVALATKPTLDKGPMDRFQHWIDGVVLVGLFLHHKMGYKFELG